MATVTIPKRLAKDDDLVVVPRKEYEALIALRRIREFTPAPSERRALLRAERNLKKGKALSYNELARRLGSTR
jgi:hypothetical protein